MKINRRNLLILAGASAFLGQRAAIAQPGKLKILVGFAAGGAADSVARAISEGLRKTGFSTIVENKAGASGQIAIESLVNGTVAGDTALLCPLSNLTLQPNIFKNLRYAPLKDVVAIGGVAEMSFGLAVRSDSSARNLREFLDIARRDTRMAAYATPGVGSEMHFIGSLLAREAKVSLMNVPYKGGAAAINDLLGGVVPAVIATTPALVSMYRAGKIRILATTGAVPELSLSDVPTFKSEGLPDLDQEDVFALFAKAGTPESILTQLQKATLQAARVPRVVEILKNIQLTPVAMDGSTVDKLVRTQYAKWNNIVKEIGYTSES